MAEATLLGFKITRISMVNSIKEQGELRLANTSGFTVDYTPDNTQAIAELTTTLELANHPGDFHIDLTIEGTFSLTGIVNIETKKDTHLMCYDLLFPVASQFVELLASNSGFADLKLKKNTIKRESIHFGEQPEDGKIIDFPEQ